MGLTLTRGLVWLEDVHYNGDKDGPDQGTHTFTWDDLGFDGPVLPRDLAFDVIDVIDAMAPIEAYPGLLNLGWNVPTAKAAAHAARARRRARRRCGDQLLAPGSERRQPSSFAREAMPYAFSQASNSASCSPSIQRQESGIARPKS